MVKPGDASMASPFTAKDTCIMPCTDIIKQVQILPNPGCISRHAEAEDSLHGNGGRVEHDLKALYVS